MLTYLKTYLTLLAFGVFCSAYAQLDNDFQAGLYNIALGGVLGGVGAMINKTPQQTTGQALWKGSKEGALGGYLIFEGKRMVRRFSRSGDYAYLWPAKILHSAGTAMVENAAANQAFGSQWHLNIGFNRIEYHPFAKEKKFKYRIMPFSLGGTIIASLNGQLNLPKSLRSGTLIFEGSGSFEHLIDDNIDFEPDGLAIYNVILLKENTFHFSKNDVIAHELIHVFQYEELSAVNTFLNKPYAHWNNHKLIDTYHKWFYTDLNALLGASIYNLFGSYETNFYELEAEYYR